MPKFIIAYRGGKKPATQEESKKHLAKWQKWFADIKEKIISHPVPLGVSKIVSQKNVLNGGESAMTGYLVISADDLNMAVEIAKSDPFLEMQGAIIEVAQIMEMRK